jgi:tetratricopeptide (TPR) repeat protein
MQQYRVNIGLLVGLGIGSLVLIGATWGLHKFQVDRNADALIAAGEQAQQDGKLKDAIREYSNYLSVRRSDDKVRVKLANLWADVVEQPKFDPEDPNYAVAYLEDFVRQMPEEKALQKRLVDLYGRFGQLQPALDHLGRMLEKYPDDAELQVEQVKYLLQARKFDGADGALVRCKRLIGYDDKTDTFDAKKAIAPHEPIAYTNCAALLRSVQNKPELADRVMDQLVKENPELPAAYLQRGQYYTSMGEQSRGRRDFDKAYQLAPKDADVLLSMAAQAEANKRTDRAREFLNTGLKEHPKDARFYQGLAGLEMSDKKYKEALAYIADGLKHVPDDEAQNLLFYKAELQFMAQDLPAVRLTKEEMRKAGFREEFLRWIDARILLSQNKWYEASQILAELQSQLGSSGPYADQLGMQLGLAYEKSGQLDKAEMTYQAVLKRSPNNEPAKAGVQRVAMMLRRPERNPKTDDLEQRIAEILKQPKNEQDWTKINADLAKLAEERKIEGAALDLFWARLLLARQDFPEARKRLVAGRTKDPKNVDIQRLAVVLLRFEDPEQGPAKSMRLLDQITKEFGDKADLRLDRADGLIALNQQKRDDDKLKQELSALENIPTTWDENDQVTFWNGMAARYLSLGMRDEAKASLNHVVALRPNELPTRVALFTLALEANDDVEMKETQDQLLRVVGSKEDSNWLYSEARRLLSLYRRGQADKDSLEDVRKLTDRAMQERPNWFELQLLSAELALLEGNAQEALTHFEKAQELGQPNANAVLQHVRLLLAAGRFEPAKALIEQLPEAVRDGDLGQVYAEVLMNTGHVSDAVKVIQKFAAGAPEAADRQLALGQLLTRAAGDPDATEARRKELLSEADKALKSAVKLGPEVPQTWLALLSYQVMQQDQEGAKQTLQQAQLGLAEDQLVAILAKGNEIMGQWFNAENVYLTALESQPENLLLAQELANFYLSQSYPRPDKFVKATPLVNRILHAGADGKLESNDPTMMWARRAAAQMLADTGDYQQLRKAENLLASNAEGGALPAEDRLRMGRILAARRDPISRRKAKELFEQVQKDQRLDLQSELLLGQLYFSLGEWDLCKRHMQTTVARNPKSFEVRATFINMLLQRGSERDINEIAARNMNELMKLAPNNLATIKLMVELGGKSGKQEQVRKYLLGLLPKNVKPDALTDDQVGMMEFVASLLVTLDDLDDAENIYRAIVARDPNKVLALAEFLGTHRNVDESMKMLESVYKPELTQPVGTVAIGVVRARRDEIGDKYDGQVEGWLDRGLLENPESVPLLMLQAEFADVEKKYDEAADIYKKLLARKDVTGITRAIVLNNLAFLVALTGNETEAGVNSLELVQQAAQILGPTADILDTQAVIYTSKGDYQKAIRDLDNSLTENPTAAKYFHKAQAHLGAGENTAAIKAWDDAHKLEKDVRSTLNRMEFKSYDEIKPKIEQLRGQNQKLTRAAA